MEGRRRFGPYELGRRLGAGGMAETFAAIRRGPGGFEQHVCLKRILPAFEEDADFVRLFLGEAKIAAGLRHANIVQVVDFGVVEGAHFMALELVDGMDMRAVLALLRSQGEAFTSGLVSHLAFELTHALDFAHRADSSGKAAGVVHRDVSPSNVLLSCAGEVKLADFGIAKAMNQTHVTKSGVIKGKVPYMAPEYALSGECDARSDLFALGVTLYEALTGRRPFDGATELDTLRRIQEGEHRPLSEVSPTTPEALAKAIERLIEPEPGRRFANAPALLDALVDVAPPPTAKRILGELVRGARKAADEAAACAKAVGDVPVGAADTLRAATSGTAILPEAGDAPGGEVRPAAHDAETRTRLPEGHEDDAPPTDPDPALALAGAETRQLEVETAPPLATAAPPRPRASRVLAWLGGALLLASAAVAAAWLGGASSEPTTDAPSPDLPATVDPSPLPPGSEGSDFAPVSAPLQSPDPREAGGDSVEPRATRDTRPHGSPSEADRPTQAAAEPSQGILEVVVVPFGDVWIDGRRVGSSPVRLEVAAGPHTIAAGVGEATKRTTARVRAGRTRRVVIR